MSWTSKMVDELVTLKRTGVDDYEVAWRMAEKAHPPMGRDLGSPRPTLFPETGLDESVVEFMHRACGDAWHGRRPELRGLQVLLERNEILMDDRTPGIAARGKNRGALFAA